MLVFYRSPIISGFTHLQGSNSDTRLLSYLNEHWYLVFRGKAAWRNPSYFFPVSDDLGYTDAFALFQPFYAPLRILGLDQFLAFQLTTMLLSSLGFFSCLVMLSKVIQVRFSIALAGSFTFAFANNLLQQSEHGQLYAVHFLPLVVILAWSAFSAVEKGHMKTLVSCSIGLGAMSALLLFTSFYIGWFLIFVTAVLTLVVTASTPAFRHELFKWPGHHARLLFLLIITALASFAIFALPFFMTYLPMLGISKGAPYSDVMTYMPRVGDLLNFGDGNLMWGWLRPLGLYDSVSPGANERCMAITPWLAISTLVGAVFALRSTNDVRAYTRLRLALGASITVILLTILTLRFGDFSFWKFVRDYVPGAEQARAMARIQLVLNLVVISAWAVVVDQWARRSKFSFVNLIRPSHRSAGITFVAIAATIMFVPLEQISSFQLDELSRKEQATLLQSVPTPPADCVAFFVGSVPSGKASWIAQIDAMLISHRMGLPTLNGYSGIYPVGWFLADPNDPNSDSEVVEWLALNGVEAVICRYDMEARSWSHFTKDAKESNTPN